MFPAALNPVFHLFSPGDNPERASLTVLGPSCAQSWAGTMWVPGSGANGVRSWKRREIIRRTSREPARGNPSGTRTEKGWSGIAGDSSRSKGWSHLGHKMSIYSCFCRCLAGIRATESAGLLRFVANSTAPPLPILGSPASDCGTFPHRPGLSSKRRRHGNSRCRAMAGQFRPAPACANTGPAHTSRGLSLRRARSGWHQARRGAASTSQ